MRAGRTQYTDATGLPALRERISALVRAALRPRLSRRGASSSPRAPRRRCSSPASRSSSRDDEVLLPDPSYPCNRHFVAAAEGRAGAAAGHRPRSASSSAPHSVRGGLDRRARAACCSRRRRTRPARRSTRTRWRRIVAAVRARGGFTHRRRDLPRPELRRALRPQRAACARRRRDLDQQLLEVLQHDRLAARLAGGARGAGRADREAGAEPVHLPVDRRAARGARLLRARIDRRVRAPPRRVPAPAATSSCRR